MIRLPIFAGLSTVAPQERRWTTTSFLRDLAEQPQAPDAPAYSGLSDAAYAARSIMSRSDKFATGAAINAAFVPLRLPSLK
jgi:hypothetical protein